MTFVPRESFFDATVTSGEPLSIPIGDGPRDTTRLVVQATVIDASGKPVSLPKKL